MADDDIALMLAFKNGDYNAFATLVDRYQRPLIQYFYAQSPDLQRAEDCTQEVWRRVFRSRDSYTPKAQFKTYLFRIARNLWIDTFRSRSKHGDEVSLDNTSTDAGGSESTPLGRALPSNASTPVEELSRTELKERIEAALSRLPESQREVFVLAEFQGMRYAEIGDVLQIPVGTVKSRMFNAMRRLRELLERDTSP